jgi:hypothetical protein
MDALSFIIGILGFIVAIVSWRSQKRSELTIDELKKDIKERDGRIERIEEFDKIIMNNTNTMVHGHSIELSKIERELRREGLLELAKKINTLINDTKKTSQEAYIILDSYMKNYYGPSNEIEYHENLSNKI